jgi:hypothetical protein
MVATMDSPTIRQLRTQWQAIGAAPQSRTACQRLAACEPVIAHLQVDDLAELVELLSLTSHRLSRNEAAAVIAAMLRSAGVDVLIPRAIIQALIPGVVGLSRRVDSADGPWSDLDPFFVDAISCLWEQIITWSGTTRPFAAGDLLSGVRTRLRTLQASERRHRCRRVDSPDALDLIAGSIGRTGEELLTADLIEATGHGLTPTDASLLYSTAILGMSVAEVADYTGESVVRLRRRRRNVIPGWWPEMGRHGPTSARRRPGGDRRSSRGQ